MAVSPAPPDLLLAYAEAQAALARLADRVTLSPVRGPLQTRIALAERQALAALDSLDLPEDALTVDARGRVATTPYDLTHWKQAIGQPIALTALAHDPAALLAWLGADQPRSTGGDSLLTAADRDPTERLAAITRWQKAPLPPTPPLLQAARMADLWRQHAPLGRGDRVASLLIGDRWGAGRWPGSSGGLTALGLRHAGGLWKIARGGDLDRLWLDAVRVGADAHLETETRLRAYAGRVAPHLASRRRLGRLKEVILFAMARPAISSAQVAQALKLTSAGAIKLLSIAVSEGLLLERTGQASYRSYAIPVSQPVPGRPAPGRRRRPAADPFAADFWTEEDGFSGVEQRSGAAVLDVATADHFPSMRPGELEP
ncbi:hypothetical protein [Sphingobium sp. TKS]|nr:hypothetical protein [Sphingobium sp. TKS]AMK26452.1 hypothetical protein K426_27765 [Sphingobium sp. TKS]